MILPLFCSCLSHYCARGIGTPVILPIEFSISLCYNSRRQVFGKGETMMAQRERKLTEKELKRKENFEKLCSEIEQNGYIYRLLFFPLPELPLSLLALEELLHLREQDSCQGLHLSAAPLLFLWSGFRAAPFSLQKARSFSLSHWHCRSRASILTSVGTEKAGLWCMMPILLPLSMRYSVMTSFSPPAEL